MAAPSVAPHVEVMCCLVLAAFALGEILDVVIPNGMGMDALFRTQLARNSPSSEAFLGLFEFFPGRQPQGTPALAEK